jgi:hypothetical protein
MKYKSRKIAMGPYEYLREEGEAIIRTHIYGRDIFTDVWIPPRRDYYAFGIYIPWGKDPDEVLDRYPEVTKEERAAIKEHIAEVAEREGI